MFFPVSSIGRSVKVFSPPLKFSFSLFLLVDYFPLKTFSNNIFQKKKKKSFLFFAERTVVLRKSYIIYFLTSRGQLHPLTH